MLNVNERSLHRTAEQDRDVLIVSAVRTPIGRYGGALASVRPDDMAARVLRESVDRAGVQPEALDEVIFGATNQAGEDNRNVARMAALLAELPGTPGYTVNRLCGSGLQAINDAAALIASGGANIVVAGGTESMTRAPYVVPKPDRPHSRMPQIFETSLGWRMVNPRMPPEHTVSMGLGAEHLAEKYDISRAEQDEFALRSHQRAVAAADKGSFDAELVDIEAGRETVARDESPRAATSLEQLAALKPAFKPGGTVTAGNSSPLNDGAAALVLASRDAATKLGIVGIARIRSFATAAVSPREFGIAPVPAIARLLARERMSLDTIDRVELNEAFAAQTLACERELGVGEERLNPDGGAIALGHPLGCSGARLVVTLVHGLKRRGGGRGIASLCIAVGQGIATLVDVD